jgi:hypothetical protein
MHRMNSECLDSDRSGPSIAVTILLREEPDEDEEEDDDRKEEHDDDDEGDGYSERPSSESVPVKTGANS